MGFGRSNKGSSPAPPPARPGVWLIALKCQRSCLRAYLRTSWSVPQFGPDQTPYQSSTYLNYFDCDTGRIAYTGNRYFVGTEPEGTPIHQEAETPLDKLKFQRVVPGSAGASRLEFVCKFRSKNFRT